MLTRRFSAAAARALLLAAVVPGCTPYDLTVNQGNYLTFEHPFNDATFEDVRRRAVDLCGGRKQVAVKSENVCNLTLCTTTYQCMDKEDAEIFQKNR
jgi:hypothetical protein